MSHPLEIFCLLALGAGAAVFCGGRIYRGLKTGEIVGRMDTPFFRKHHPIGFWLNLGAYFFFGAVALGIVTVGLMQ